MRVKIALMSIFLITLAASGRVGVYARGVAGNIKLIMMKNNQYWFSTTSPYAPTLNFFLAYEYCRNLGLQLTTLETKDEIDTIALYLVSTEGSGGVRDYWTSGNKLGADSWLWMSNGEQMNATFAIENGLQSQSQRQSIPGGGQKNCLTLRSLSTRRTIFTPEACDRALPFICEQIRCLSYYYPTVEFPDPAATETEFSSGSRSETITVVVGNETSLGQIVTTE